LVELEDELKKRNVEIELVEREEETEEEEI
jgi:hypothetical protein